MQLGRSKLQRVKKRSTGESPIGSERGSSLVEAAITLPVVVGLLVGVIQYGFIFSSYLALRTATANGARYWTVIKPSATSSEVQAIVETSLGPLLSSAQINTVNLSEPSIGSPPTEAKQVEVFYDLPLFFSFVVPNANAGLLSLRAVTVMR